jgi:tight adherence protein B
MTHTSRRLLALLGVSAACLLLPLRLASADPGDSTDTRIQDVTSSTGALQFVLSVGNLSSGTTLDPQSVVVKAGGETLEARAAQADAAVDRGALPIREAIFLLDQSGSMQGEGIAGARAAALAYAAHLPEDVRVGLVSFNDTTHTLLAPTRDRKALDNAVAKVKPTGGTALYDAIAAAAEMLKSLPASADRRILIMSDGRDTHSTTSLAQVTDELRSYGIPADVVAFRIPSSESTLQHIAASSGGKLLPAGSASDLAAAFSTAAEAFRQQMLVNVVVPADLAFKHVTLQVTANAGGESVSATARVTMPSVNGASAGGPPLEISAPHGKVSNTTLWVMLGCIFAGLLVAALVALFLPILRAERNRRAQRLAEIHRYRVVGAIGAPTEFQLPVRPAQNSALAERALGIVDKTVRARGQRDQLLTQLDRAGLRMRPEEWAIIQVAAVIVFAALIAVLARSPIGLPFGGIIGWLLCRYFIRSKTTRRLRAFEDQLPDTLQLLAGSLRSGFSLSQAISGVVREGTEPTAGEFARALAEVRIGADLEDALDNVADRMECEDLRLVVMAMRIAREVGGNLAEVLQNTVVTMRERAQLRGTVRVLSAEGRISAKVLIGLPFLLGGFLLLFKRGYLTPLVTTVPGAIMLIVGAVLMVIGSFWLSRLTRIEV